MKKKLKLVRIDWVDSCGYSGWREAYTTASMIKSAGWLVAETKTTMTISDSYDTVCEKWSDQMVIPKIAIIKKTFLK